MKKTIIILIATVALGSFLFFNKLDQVNKREGTYQADKNNAQAGLKHSIDLGQEWLVNYQKANGLFRYIYHPDSNSFANDESMVRQVGTFWGLIRTYGFTKNENVLATINNFRQGIQAFIKYDTINDTKIAFIEYDELAQINSQAFYILALAELKKQGFELTPREQDDMGKMLTGIYLMENEEGGLWYIYYLPEEYNKISIYGTSEAIFALISYYKYIEQDEEVLAFSKKHFHKYFELGKDYKFPDDESRSFYAWVLYYLYELYEIEPEYYQYIDFLVQKTMDFRSDNPECKSQGCIIGKYPVAESNFLEGSAVVYELIAEKNPPLSIALKDYLIKAADLLIDMQVKSFPDYEKRKNKEFTGNGKYLIGGFCSGAHDDRGQEYCINMRNDFNQHSICALTNIYTSL